MSNNTLKVYSIFPSIDGEVNTYGQGHPTAFLRLMGCNLKCTYCDTQYAQNILHDGGGYFTPEEIENQLQKIIHLTGRKLTITGGEPLLQCDVLFQLIKRLVDPYKGWKITIETNGTVLIPNKWAEFRGMGVHWVMDLKLPDASGRSAMEADPDWVTFSKNHQRFLYNDDWVKLVVGSEQDFQTGLAVLRNCDGLPEEEVFYPWPHIAISPVHGKVTVDDILEWARRADFHDFVINLQLHKYIWPKLAPGEER